MSNYSITTNFLAKDGLVSGNPAKLILGAQLTTEFANIVTAITSKYDSATTTITLSGALAAATGTFTGAGTVPLTIQELTAPPNNVINAYIGVGTAAFSGGSGINGDLILAPRSNNACSVNIVTGSGAQSVRLAVSSNGNVVITAPSGGLGLQVAGAANQYTTQIVASGVSGQSYGLVVNGGTTSADTALLVRNQAGTANFLVLKGDGSGSIGAGSALGLNWATTGAVSIPAPSSGIALSLTGAAGFNSFFVLAPNTASNSFGAVIQAGTNTNDYALRVLNATGGTEFARIYGTGGVQLGGVAGGDQGLGALNAAKLFLAGVSIVQKGAFTGTLTGCTTAPTATFNYTIVNGTTVSIDLTNSFTGTSNTNVCAVTGLPAALSPLRTQIVPLNLTDNGLSVTGSGIIGGGGSSISLTKSDNSGTFTTSGSKGVNGFVCTYNLV